MSSNKPLPVTPRQISKPHKSMRIRVGCRHIPIDRVLRRPQIQDARIGWAVGERLEAVECGSTRGAASDGVELLGIRDDAVRGGSIKGGLHIRWTRRAGFPGEQVF